MAITMSATIPTELRELGEFSTILKAQILAMRGVTFGQLRRYIENKIAEKGYRVLFPVNVNPGKVLSHHAPNLADQSVYGEEDYTTVDFGILHEECIVDTAVTLVKPKTQPVLDMYRACMSKAIESIGQLYERNGFVRVKDVTRIVQECYYYATIVEECCSHEIKKSTLYESIIPMSTIRHTNKDGDRVLRAGSQITLQPHVCVNRNYALRESPGHIHRVGEIYQYTDTPSDQISEIHLNHAGFYEEHVLYFEQIDGKGKLSIVT